MSVARLPGLPAGLARSARQELGAVPPVAMDDLIARARQIFAQRGVAASRQRACAGCLGPLPPKAIKWCSETCRKDGYAGACANCGAKLSGSDGRGPNAPRRCDPCARRHRARWDRDLVIARMLEWTRRFGRPPTSTEWHRATARGRGYIDALAILDADPHHWPHTKTVTDLFGTWNAALDAADLPHARCGRGNRTPLLQDAS